MSVETEIDSLRRTIDRIIHSSTVDLAVRKRNGAEIAALFSIVLDLAKREGLSEERFQEVFQLRSGILYQRFLESTEDVSPTLAVQLETIIPSKSDLGADWPLLFQDL